MERCNSFDQKIGEKITYRHDSAITTMLAFFLMLFVSGCASVTEYGIWGEDAALRPGWERIKNAAINAALAPATWIPLTGAAVLQIDHMDEDLSEYASDHTPVFGSRKDAGDASDDLRDLARASYYITALRFNRRWDDQAPYTACPRRNRADLSGVYVCRPPWKGAEEAGWSP